MLGFCNEYAGKKITEFFVIIFGRNIFENLFKFGGFLAEVFWHSHANI